MGSNIDSTIEGNITVTKDENQAYFSDYKKYETEKDIKNDLDDLDNLIDIEYAKLIEVSGNAKIIELLLDINDLRQKLLFSKINSK